MRKKRLAAAARQFNPFSKGRLNQAQGAAFEARIQHAAAMDGLLCIENGLRAKWVRGRLMATPQSQLDMLLVGNATTGQIAMCDAKVIGGTRFGRSRLTPHQLGQAIRFAERGMVAGFIVYMPEANEHVGFYHADLLASGKDRQGFAPSDSVTLGHIRSFSLLPIWAHEVLQ